MADDDEAVYEKELQRAYDLGLDLGLVIAEANVAIWIAVGAVNVLAARLLRAASDDKEEALAHAQFFHDELVKLITAEEETLQ